MEKLLSHKLLYSVPVWTHQKEILTKLLQAFPNIQFVSLVGVDLRGNNTDEKIPISILLEDVDGFLQLGVQTDGSSVMLHEIATLNNAKVDLIPDLDVNWYIDYNADHLHPETGLPVGTLRIPAFLAHDGRYVGSRGVLKRMEDYFGKKLLSIFTEHPSLLAEYGIDSVDAIERVKLTAATELEFWVRTPQDKADEEKLSASQTLKEQYWKRTKGSVRSALEESIMMLGYYGLDPEMGHKEVGGVTAKISNTGKLNHVMEQLEIDWKYNTPMETADNEAFVREIVEEVFERHGLEVTFQAKPIEGVAGCGKHTHMGIALLLKNGQHINLMTAQKQDEFMSSLGWGCLMGLLENYEAINPFITSSNDAFNRLKPGFEAPVCIVASVGHTPEMPSRNRTVLVGLVRDLKNPLATRFELRAPNPMSNTYLYVAASYQMMLDGIGAVAQAELSSKELETEFSKKAGEEKFYLAKDRMFHSEHDVFDDYTEEERNALFGKPPATVWENISNFNKALEKRAKLFSGDVFTEIIVRSYELATLDQWVMEISGRLIPLHMKLVRNTRKLHGLDYVTDLDVVNWEKINAIRYDLMKDSLEKKSFLTQLREAIAEQNYEKVSGLQLLIADKAATLKQLYLQYRRNLLEETNGN
ncbi:MAG: glutamine synthetase [Bacillota bacterium]|nr:glutamine synthetase [Bacillota bacterium]MDW7678024.1 glutamine synthetase [Bacillota bacterium]